jgi:hypothetical protein
VHLHASVLINWRRDRAVTPKCPFRPRLAVPTVRRQRCPELPNAKHVDSLLSLNQTNFLLCPSSSPFAAPKFSAAFQCATCRSGSISGHPSYSRACRVHLAVHGDAERSTPPTETFVSEPVISAQCPIPTNWGSLATSPSLPR